MSKVKKEFSVQNNALINETQLFKHVALIIESSKSRVTAHVNH